MLRRPSRAYDENGSNLGKTGAVMCDATHSFMSAVSIPDSNTLVNIYASVELHWGLKPSDLVGRKSHVFVPPQMQSPRWPLFKPVSNFQTLLLTSQVC